MDPCFASAIVERKGFLVHCIGDPLVASRNVAGCEGSPEAAAYEHCAKDKHEKMCISLDLKWRGRVIFHNKIIYNAIFSQIYAENKRLHPLLLATLA